jgi:hypothetical protein
MNTPKALLRQLEQRDGHACAMCGVDDETLVPHHRANRGIGGRRSLDRLSNLVWLCSLDNGRIESDAGWAAEARALGIKISSHDEPSHVPMIHPRHGRCLLADDGTVHTGLEVF